MSDPTLEAANRAAHKYAQLSSEHRHLVYEWAKTVKEHGNRSPEATEMRRKVGMSSARRDNALDEYEEAERRAQEEATR